MNKICISTKLSAFYYFQALSSTHLYGRHLVLEWAEDKDDVETLREKAAKDLAKAMISNRRGGIKEDYFEGEEEF